MKKIYIVGNPNTGKSTLFNSLTKSDEHVGNWHGVTVKEKSKIVKFKDEEIEFFDLPGMYSLNTYSFEEEVSLNLILNSQDANILYIMDANNIKRNMYLLLQLLSLDVNLKVLINNYDYFEKSGEKIDLVKLKNHLGCDVEVVNAKKIKLNKNLLNFNKTNKKIKNNLEINEIYKEINFICENSINNDKNKVYGISKLDKYLLKPYIFVPLIILLIFFSLFLIFFLIGPILNDFCSVVLNIFIRQPVLYFLHSVNSSGWIIRVFDEAIFSSLITICSFLPQVCMLYTFLSLLEQSGLIARMAFMLDDYFSKVGLNGKCVYTMLMSFGCNTSAIYTSKNMSDKNSQIKSALISPFMSCTAKLPIYAVVVSAIFGAKNILVILGLYLLGIVLALILAYVYSKTILKSKKNDFLIEFPPLKIPNINDTLKSGLKTSKEFLYKVFGIIFSMSVVIWVLSNVGFNFKFTSYEHSIIYGMSKKVSWMFKPLGLDSPYIICTLLVGLVAKELIVSSMLIFNKTSTTAALITSLKMSSSAISFNVATGLSFLVFVLLYSPCVSSIAVLFSEAGKKFAILGVVVELVVAYLTAMLTYNIASGNLLGGVISVIFVAIIIGSFVFSYKKIKKGKICSSCASCKKCNLKKFN